MTPSALKPSRILNSTTVVRYSPDTNDLEIPSVNDEAPFRSTGAGLRKG